MHQPKSQPVTTRDVWITWYPLALSWLMMGIELPLLSAVVARLDNPEVNLGAYGGVVFPLALLIEAPIIMLLTASTKLSRDLASYRKLWRFMMIAGGALSALHLLVAVTPPLFNWLVGDLLGVVIGVQANVGGVGIAMILLLVLSNLGDRTAALSPITEKGIGFWSAMYIPIVVAMAARQNVAAALSGGWMAIIAGVAAVAASFALIPVLARVGQGGQDDS